MEDEFKINIYSKLINFFDKNIIITGIQTRIHIQ